MTEAFWTELAIAPTDDRSAIRKAYARRLKTIDPEADPQASIALRGAHDAALHWLQWKDFDAQFEAEAESAELAAEQGAASVPIRFEPEASQPPPFVSPWHNGGSEASSDLVDRRAMEELDRLLFDGDPETSPDPAVLQAVTHRILADPALERIDQADAIGAWLADTIADSSPKSDPIVTMVAEHFGWTGQQDSWNQNFSIAYVVARHEGLSLLGRIAQSNHPWHPAYLSLISDRATLGFREKFGKQDVKDLLDFVRLKAPEAEGRLDAHRVALWDDAIYGASEGGYKGSHFTVWSFLALGVFAIVKLFLGN